MGLGGLKSKANQRNKNNQIKSMAKGGKRVGAGRKRGSLTKRTREVARAVAKTGITPLEYMLKVMRNPRADADRRDRMAAAAAPFMHPRLQAAINPVDPTKPPVQRIEVAFV
jgi:hypothetical protein